MDKLRNEFHAKHPLAELKLKGAKVSVTIEYNQTLIFVSGFLSGRRYQI